MPSERKLRSRGKDETEVAGDSGDVSNVASPGSPEKSNGKRKASTGVERESSRAKITAAQKSKKAPGDLVVRLAGDPVPDSEARQRWPDRYAKKKKGKKGAGSRKGDGDDEEVLQAQKHYTRAEIDGCIFNLNDDAYIKGEDGAPDYIGKIVELFESTDNKPYFTAQWFFKAEDTVIKNHAHLIDKRRVFFSDLRDDNPLDCIVSRLIIAKVAPNTDLAAKEAAIPHCDYYCDMTYSLSYSTFANFPDDNTRSGSEESTISTDESSDEKIDKTKFNLAENSMKMTLLDLYSGCGAMSTGLCLGANKSGVNLVTRWAVDLNSYACESLKLNHPETEVRNESADNFLNLIKEWEKLCREYSSLGSTYAHTQTSIQAKTEEDEDNGDESECDDDSEAFEVEKLIGICFGDPNETKATGLHFKVRWKGYGPSEDTWEPIDGLTNCRERIQEFVVGGHESNILPLPGDVHVICGGPPCQGASGFNRFRNKEAPLEDMKNQQLVVFMDIVDYLKPKYVLMENVVDILKFAGGFLGRYALSRLVAMNYQARLGMMAAGCYGLPQFRMRVFLWGACPSEKLPQYPLPTHDVVVRGVIPQEFEQNVVAFDEDQARKLEKALYLGDAISDLPEIGNYEDRDEMPYGKAARTEFEKHIRLSMHELLGFATSSQKTKQKPMLYDHRPLRLNDDDYQRVCHVPKEKGANFRNLPGVKVRPDKKVEWDESIERVFLPSGKPLVPDYAMTFVQGSSTKPFARLWWDETVPTVVTRAEPHNQAIMHPTQDRVLSIRENARLQGFPDCYKLCGPVKERYIQVGNAVAVPVARALGYALGMACRGMCGDKPLFTLPPKFPYCLEHSSSTVEDDVNS